MLQTGAVFPNFSYDSYDGRTKDLYAEIGQNPAVILFLRYVGCTKCQLDMHRLKAIEPRIRQKGIRLFLVFQSDAENVRQAAEDFPFEIICDPEQSLYHRFEVLAAKSREELLDLENFSKEHQAFQQAKAELGLVHGRYEGNELQKPAAFVLDANKKILLAHYAASLMDMPLAEEWIELLPDL